MNEAKRKKLLPFQVCRKNTRTVPLSALDSSQLDPWKHEIKGLLSRQFKSVDDAIGPVVDAVLSRLGFTGDLAGEVRDELTTLFQSDKALRQELAAIFGIEG